VFKMNIDKVIFKIKDKQYSAVKCYGYKYITKYLGKNLIYQKRFKRYFPYWKVVENNKIKRYDNLDFNRMFDYLTRLDNDFTYVCYDHNNNLINKDFNFYKYLTIKDMKLNKGIKDLSLASDVINDLSMELLLK
tara:strand:+ start:320 stop:721 length:402 start_codon:yes stop_codon:yes gene_type:complete